jgi:predicted negative regulator of RcsB-dependent stress response
MANHLDLEEQEQLDQLKHFWNTWGTPITAVLVVVMGGLAAWNGYQYWQNRQASQAAALLDAVEVAAQSKDQSRLEQAFADLKAKYAGTIQADMGGFALAKTMQEAENLDAAKAALTWVSESSSDAGYKAIAKLRLAAVLVEQKDFNAALQQLQGSFPAEFDGVVADRKGDVLVLLDRKPEAIVEYTRAFKGLDETIEYRRLVEIKLNALGVDPQATSSGVAVSSDVKK